VLRTPNSPGFRTDDLSSQLSPPNGEQWPPAGADRERAHSDLPAPASQLAAGWGPRVLVVDDDEVSRLAAVGLLKTLGLTVDVASNGRQALEMSSRWAYTAIFMDCGMPDMDGYAVARQLRRREGTQLHTPVIAVTSHPRSVSLASGMDHHLAKPLRIDVLAPDCTRMGLVARDEFDAPGATDALAADTPLLDPSMFEELARDYRLSPEEPAAMFIEKATSQLPELWRAANAGDGATLRRLAVDLQARAAVVGARRIADLCDHLREAAGRRGPALAAGIAGQIRQAVHDTNVALRAYVDGASTATTAQLQAIHPAEAGAIAVQNDSDPRALVRVALADDDALARVAIAAMLESADWLELVGRAWDVDGIVELAAAQRPDVVVLDWLMPGGGGAEAARRILDHRRHTLIVGLTSSDSREALSEMTSAGAACVVAKGGSAEQLTQTIGRALKASALARAAEDRRSSGTPGPGGVGKSLSSNARPGPGDGGTVLPSTRPAPRPLDPQAVERLRSEFGPTGVLAELVDLFGSQTPERLAYLRRAIEADNAAAVSDHAHQLKGGCLTLAATNMAELCDELETTSRDGSLNGAAARVDRIEASFKRTQVALLRELA
jgi:CheY-like chemotaxis protein